MKNRYFIVFTLVLSTCYATNAFSAEITWNLYLGSAMSQGPVLSRTTLEGQEFTFGDYVLKGSQTQYSSILNDLEGTTFLLQQSTQAIEIRIILNCGSSMFDKAGSVITFLNMTIEVLVNGKVQEAFPFSTGSPLVITIPKGSGLDNLLDRCNYTRDDYLMFVYYKGGNFDNTGIETYNQISGMIAQLHHSSIVVGGLGENFGYPQNFQFSPWYKIKELFK
jgi:hypothetical protein